MVFLSSPQPRLDYLDISLGRCNVALRFLLEGVQDINDLGEPDGMDAPIRVSVMVVDDLDNTASTEALEGFGIRVFTPSLSDM